MVKERRRLRIPPQRLASRLALEAEESHYLARVLRLRHGDPLEVIDGVGGLWSARFEPPQHLLLEQPPHTPQRRTRPPRPLTLALAVPKRDGEVVWRMATELGATHLQPLVAERSVVREGMPLARWRAIVKEATEQCERLWLPELAAPMASSAWLALPPGGVALLACARQPQQGMASQAEEPPAARLAGQPGGQASGQAGGLASGQDRLSVAIGPEGGWSPQEEAIALAAGWQRLDLGPAILRSSTAAVAAVALLSLGPWRSGVSS